MMPNALVALLIAFIVTLALTPLVRRLAVARQILDRPDAGLKPHQRPIPYLGGIALYAGWAGALAVAATLAPATRSVIAAVVAAGTVLMLVGLVDDLRDLRPRTKLALQAAAAAGLLLLGTGRELAPRIFAGTFDPGGDPASWGWSGILASGALVTFLIAGATNATNMIDGLDGLCAGVTAVSALGFSALAIGATSLPGSTLVPADNHPPLLIAGALLGACLGFLPHNYHPARIFMGDSGSLLLGFNAAALMILFGESGGMPLFLGSIVVFGFPILDAALAIARRARAGRPWFMGDRSHLYDQLRDRGWSVRRTANACYLIGLACAALGAMAVVLPLRWLVPMYALAAGGAVVALVRLRMLRVDDAAERSRGDAGIE